MAKKPTQIEGWQLDDAARLKAIFKARAALNQSEFGARYDIGNQGYVWQLLNGRRPLNIDVARKFAAGLGCTIDDFSPTLAGRIAQASEKIEPRQEDDEPEFVAIQRLDVRISGGRGELVFAENELGRLSFRADFLRAAGAAPDQTVSVSVKGNSMEPLIPDGSVILVNRGNTAIISGKIYAFRLDGEILVKRLYLGNGGLIARSENLAGGYPDIHIDSDNSDAEVLGRAFWVGFKLQ